MARKSARFGQPAVYNASAPTLTDGDDSALNVDDSGNLKTSSATLLAGEDLTNGVMKVEDRSSYTNLTASALVKTGAGRVKGIFVASASATPTIKLWDNTSAATTILVNTFTPVAATMYSLPDVEFNTGLYVTISGTVDCTVFWK